ncbi:hypothetical protein [Nocardia sp.]|uniref:hypothetical protein n=1 Tax=Nocardia sp. TaxID=1821 RepID=UPI002587DE58|nr:hypothetical protein [Nocardia sp.]
MAYSLRNGFALCSLLVLTAVPAAAIPLEPAPAEPAGGVIDPTCTIPQSLDPKCFLQSLSASLSG